jgi:undecaprenyl diphosphate synthase
MKVRVIGDKSGLPEDLQKSIIDLEEASKNNTGLNFQVAINYGGRNEILRAAKALAIDVKKNNTVIDDIDDTAFGQYLDTRGIPDPDLLIRTSGEQRLSNYLLWQLAYTEFYFTDTLWPDFNKAELMKAIEYYNGRTRNFGGIM